MDTTDLNPLIDSLTTTIDSLEDALTPLLTTPLRDTTRKLPLLDKAKLNVLSAYAIESLLFSYLNLTYTDSNANEFYTELARVKSYFAKIKLAEDGPAQRPTHQTLDTSAASRFIKHGLAGNEAFDAERAARQAREREGAKIKFDELNEKKDMERIVKKRKAEEAALRQMTESGDDDESSSEDASSEESGKSEIQHPRESKKRQRRGAAAESSRRKKSDKAPKGASEAFKALLDKSVPESAEQENTKDEPISKLSRKRSGKEKKEKKDKRGTRTGEKKKSKKAKGET